MNKYRAVKTEVDGITFHSKREAKRYCDLKLMVRAGEIADLCLQPVYPLTVEGKRIGKYVGDFAYRRGEQTVVEDVKGVKTPVYRLKRKLVAALYGIEIVEIA